MYAIVKTGGKQYRVEQGQSLLVERLPASDGDTVALAPLLFVDGDSVVDGEELAKVSVAARVVAHERGPKLRVVKFKPKRGYKRRTGHRQELTRLEVTEIKLAARKPRAKKSDTPAPVAAAGEAGAAPADAPEAEPKPARTRTRKPAAAKAAPAAKAPGAKVETPPEAEAPAVPPDAEAPAVPPDAEAPAAADPTPAKPEEEDNGA
jgi:large subunit ribosomal protein L21